MKFAHRCEHFVVCPGDALKDPVGCKQPLAGILDRRQASTDLGTEMPRQDMRGVRVIDLSKVWLESQCPQDLILEPPGHE